MPTSGPRSVTCAAAFWRLLRGCLRRPTAREGRLVVVLLAVFVAVRLDLVYWIIVPHVERRSAHYTVSSTADEATTAAVLARAEGLYRAWSKVFPGPDVDHPLGLRLYASRGAFRLANWYVARWAEALYRAPWSHAYFDPETPSPHQWMVHGSAHQLARERDGLHLAHWLDEGLASYFSTSFWDGGELVLGRVDTDTYPLWWAGALGLTGEREVDRRAGRFVPLHLLVAGVGGPDLDRQFNRYYLQWWSLVHFLVHGDGGRDLERLRALARCGGTLACLERLYVRSSASRRAGTSTSGSGATWRSAPAGIGGQVRNRSIAHKMHRAVANAPPPSDAAVLAPTALHLAY